MVTQLLSPIGILVQQLANSGQPLSGGQVFIYQAGTTTPITTYTDSTGATPNANPIVLNSAGRLPNVSVWVPSNTPHKMVLEDANNVTLSTIDQLYGINDPFLINQVSTTLPTGGGAANAQTIANSVAITSQANGTEQWFTPGVANTGDTTINVDSLGAMHVHYLGKVLVGGELQPNVPVIIKSDGTFWNLAWSAKGPAADTYVDTGTVNAIAVTTNMVPSLPFGMRIKVRVSNTTTSSTPTISINGGSPQSIVLSDGVTTPPAGSLISNSGFSIYDFIAASTAGPVVLVNPSRVTGSYTGTYTGCTTSPTATINYIIGIDGKTCTLEIPLFTATSNATTATITGGPAAIQPTTAQNFVAFITDSGTQGPGGMLIAAASGTLTYGKGSGFGAGGFTASGTKVLNPGLGAGVWSVVYPLSP